MRTTKDQAVAAARSIDPTCWQVAFQELMGGIAGRFARIEPRRRAAAFVRGLLAELPCKNCWTIAEHAGNPTQQVGFATKPELARVMLARAPGRRGAGRLGHRR